MQDLIFNTDLELEQGDFLVGFSDELHQKHILLAEKGEYKQYPELGVGILNLLNGENATALLIEAKQNFEYDRMKVKELKFTDQNSLHIEASY